MYGSMECLTTSAVVAYMQYGNETSIHIYSMGMRPVYTRYIQYGNETSIHTLHVYIQHQNEASIHTLRPTFAFWLDLNFLLLILQIEL